MKKILEWLRAELRRSADRKALMAMSAHELSDLGIGRTEAGYVTSLTPDAPHGLGDARVGTRHGLRAGRHDAPADRSLAHRHGVFP